MGTKDLSKKGFPSNHIRGMDYALILPCGGKGGGGLCSNPYPYNYLWWAIKVNPYAVYNRHLVLQNQVFQVFTDSGAGGGCTDNFGTQLGYKVALGYTQPTSNNPPNTTSIISVPAGVTLPDFLNWDSGNLLPQPSNANWDGHIYVTIILPQTGLMLNPYSNNAPTFSAPVNTNVFLTTNMDFDSRI